jgi:hypothetical protein
MSRRITFLHLCDVMRFLIAGNSEALPASIDEQRRFFS